MARLWPSRENKPGPLVRPQGTSPQRTSRCTHKPALPPAGRRPPARVRSRVPTLDGSGAAAEWRVRVLASISSPPSPPGAAPQTRRSSALVDGGEGKARRMIRSPTQSPQRATKQIQPAPHRRRPSPSHHGGRAWSTVLWWASGDRRPGIV